MFKTNEFGGALPGMPVRGDGPVVNLSVINGSVVNVVCYERVCYE